MPKRDVQATAARNFHDPKSFVFKDGREWLVGEDWNIRKLELWERCGGHCEYRGLGPLRCWKEAIHPHHTTLRSVKRDDRLPALMAVCFEHHLALDAEQRKQRNKRGVAA